MRTALTLFVLVVSARGVPAEPSRTEVQRAVDAIAARELSSGPTAGMSILVAQRGQILVAKGYGLADMETQTPATEHTVYRLGSLSKQFTVAAILELADQEQLDLDASIRTYLPDFPESGQAVTVRHLLQHTSGLTNYTAQSDYWRQMRDDLPRSTVMGWIASKRPAFPPGERYVYNNSGYFLLGLIVEHVSGETYAEFVQRHVLDPLGLKETYYDGTPREIPNRAKGYARDAGELAAARELNLELVFSSGAMASTVLDVHAFHKALREGKLIPAELYGLMTAPAILNDGSTGDYGMGYHVDYPGGHNVLRHGGLVFGFKTCYYYYPDEDLTIIVLMNTEQAEYRPIQDAIVRLFLPDLPQDVVWE